MRCIVIFSANFWSISPKEIYSFKIISTFYLFSEAKKNLSNMIAMILDMNMIIKSDRSERMNHYDNAPGNVVVFEALLHNPTASPMSLRAKEVNNKSSLLQCLPKAKSLWLPPNYYHYASFKWYTLNNIEVISTLSRVNMYDSLKNSPSLLK